MGCSDPLDRLTILWNQRGWVATDEMTFYLQQLHKWGLPTAPPMVAQGLADFNELFEEWVFHTIEKSVQSEKKVTLRTAILKQQHWTPVMIQATDMNLTIHSTKVGRGILHTLPCIIGFGNVEWHVDEVKRISHMIVVFKLLHGFKDMHPEVLPPQ